MFVILYTIHYFNSALLSSQRLTYLIEVGYTQSQRALIYALLPLFSILFQFLFGYLSDRFKTVKKLLYILLALSTLSGFLFYNINYQLIAYHLVLSLLSNAAIGSMTELHDIWIFSSQEGKNVNFGFIRSFGSLGWAIGCIVLTIIVGATGFKSLAYYGLLLSIVQLFIILLIRDVSDSNSIKRASVRIKDLGILLKSKDYCYAMLILFTINCSANILGFVIVDKILLLGGDAAQIGLRGMMAAAVELPLFLTGDKIYRKLGARSMLMIGTFVYTLQYVLYAFASSTKLIIAVTLLQFLGVPFYVIGVKNLIVKNSPEGYKASGQMIGPSVMNGMGAVLAPIISSFLTIKYDSDAPMYFAAILGLVAVGASFKTRTLKEEKANE